MTPNPTARDEISTLLHRIAALEAELEAERARAEKAERLVQIADNGLGTIISNVTASTYNPKPFDGSGLWNGVWSTVVRTAAEIEDYALELRRNALAHPRGAGEKHGS